MAALTLSFVFAQTAMAGFGITPPYVRNDRLTQGSTYTQKIILVRGDPVEDLKAEITISVPGIEDWFTVDKGLEFLLPKGERQVPINITVNVPSDAPLERYQGAIRIRTSSLESATGVAIALGAQIDVDLRVVDEILDFDVRRVQMSEAEEPRRVWWLDYPGKITFTMSIANTGNGWVAPSRVEFSVYDKRGTTLLEEIVNSNTLNKIKPFETGDVVAHMPTRLPPGAYLVKYKIIHREDEVKREGELTLSVLPKGTLAAYAGYGFEGLSTADKATILGPVVVVLVAVLAAGTISARRRRKPVRRRRRDDDEPPPRATPQRSTRAPVVELSSRRRLQ